MDITIDYVFTDPELNEIKNIINNSIKDYFEKYGNCYYKRLE